MCSTGPSGFGSQQGTDSFFSVALWFGPGPAPSPNQWVQATFSLEIKRPKREANHHYLVPRLKTMWSEGTPPYAVISRCFIQY